MPAVTCRGCRGLTNTACSSYWADVAHKRVVENHDAPECLECYARRVDGRWEEGCAYSSANNTWRSLVDRMLGR
jgi:hypothetical protein